MMYTCIQSLSLTRKTQNETQLRQTWFRIPKLNELINNTIN